MSPEGHTIYTSKFLKNRGTCCRTTCLHCPYGFTLKKCGITFKDVEENDIGKIESIIKESNVSVDDKPFFPNDAKLVFIKDQVCGFILKNHIVIKHLVLRPHFQDQGLSKEMVESYYFI